MMETLLVLARWHACTSTAHVGLWVGHDRPGEDGLISGKQQQNGRPKVVLLCPRWGVTSAGQWD